MRQRCLHSMLVGVIALFFVGCSGKSATPKKVIMQHPQTMEFKKCNVGQWRSESPFTTNEECIEEYKKQGYVVWGEQD